MNQLDDSNWVPSISARVVQVFVGLCLLLEGTFHIGGMWLSVSVGGVVLILFGISQQIEAAIRGKS
jgi:hypothetical protein